MKRFNAASFLRKIVGSRTLFSVLFGFGDEKTPRCFVVKRLSFYLSRALFGDRLGSHSGAKESLSDSEDPDEKMIGFFQETAYRN